MSRDIPDTVSLVPPTSRPSGCSGQMVESMSRPANSEGESWTWFNSSVLEASGVLIAGGNLIKKVLFPAEVLPIVTVLANMVHFFLGLPILAGFLIYYRRPLDPIELLWFPVIVLVQLVLDQRESA